VLCVPLSPPPRRCPPVCSEEVYEKLKKAKAELKRKEEAGYRDPAKAAEAKCVTTVV
jgi:hypothetical protein